MSECCSEAGVSSNGASVDSGPRVTSSSPRNDLGIEDNASLHSLYEKYNIQQKEIERLEEQNAEYREKLLRTIRERDLNDELLRNVRDAQKKETSELERRMRDYEIQLKAVQERATAQEAHYSVTMKDLSTKYNTSVSQLTKKADVAEKEKNDAVIKYATREAEIMKMRSELQKKDQELVESQKARQELEHSQAQENVEHLEKANNGLRVELEQMKHEKFDLENKLKLSEKRADACTATVSELKQQNDVLRKQLIQLKEEKGQLQEDNRQLSLKTQIQESRLAHESEELSRSQQDMEQRLIEANNHCTRLSETNREANARLEEVARENLDLMNKLQDLEDKLSLEEEAHTAASFEVSRLRGIENQVLGSQRQAQRAKDAQEQAEKEREVAENEAEECRVQAERMLAITEQLTQRNSQLAGEIAAEREKNCRIEQQLVETEGSLNRALAKLSEREKDLEEATGSGQAEIASLKSELNEKIVKGVILSRPDAADSSVTIWLVGSWMRGQKARHIHPAEDDVEVWTTLLQFCALLGVKVVRYVKDAVSVFRSRVELVVRRSVGHAMVAVGDNMVHLTQELATKEFAGEVDLASWFIFLLFSTLAVQQLTQRLQEERTDNAALRKKYTASIKELKHELSSLRKQVDSSSNNGSLAPPPSGDSAASTSSRSRASSLNSLDRVTTVSRDEESAQSTHVSTESATIQQVMIDKIIVLQKKLARRNEKIEFLEEHVRHSLEELQKKTKIIQHYALREEASLLLPSDGALDKVRDESKTFAAYLKRIFMQCGGVFTNLTFQVPLSRKGASYSLMGSIFTGGNDKRSLQLATEVNSRLQAVLEDALMKNITLKVEDSTFS
ncbi:unnamed protein product [Heligmosomoides polygyrus]|uniref:Cilia- and flagella-associated protein 157 n=1 Tax=Heligmosomoides polygyrus TaxID=6339 RepID=A0A3P7WTH1_HELPZ|nr:unnamed protein product [Heligmosomoides polygyrus]